MQTFQDLVQVLRLCLRFQIWTNPCALLVSSIAWTTQKANCMFILTKEQKLSQNNLHQKKICPRFYESSKIVQTTCLYMHIVNKILTHVQIGV
jgi:hypothetical protein